MRIYDADAAVAACSLAAMLSFVSDGAGKGAASAAAALQAAACAYLAVRALYGLVSGPDTHEATAGSPARQVIASLVLTTALAPVFARAWLMAPDASFYGVCASGCMCGYMGWRSRWQGWFLTPIPLLALYVCGASGYAGWAHKAETFEVMAVTGACTGGAFAVWLAVRRRAIVT